MLSSRNSIGSTIQNEENSKSDDESESTKCFGLKSKSKKKVDSKQEKPDLNDTESTSDSDNESAVLEIGAKLNEDRQYWWKGPDTFYAFNKPTIRTNLERLVGTDVMKLNDHQFMMNLRSSVWNDFDEKLTRTIKQREANEIERTKQLILKCKYNRYNCPRKLLPLHSDVLALDLHDEPIRPLKSHRLSEFEGPLFNINRRTNVTIRQRRKQIKTIRKSNFKYLMRQVLNDIALSERLEYDDTRAIQEQIKTIQNKRKKHFEFISKMVQKMKSIFKSKGV